MDEKLVEQVSSSSGIPQMLVSRSAQARAEASGVSVNDVLNSWTGGEAIQAAPANETVSKSQVVIEDTPTPVEEQVDEPVEVIEDTPTPVEEQVDEPVEVEEPENLVEQIQTAVLIKEDLPPPVSISQKLLRSLKFGLGFGVIAGFVQGLLSSSYLYDGLILEAETQKLIAEYDAVSFVIIISLSTSFLGILNSLNVKKFLDSNFDGFGILTSDRESVFTGGGLGLVLGSSTAFFIINSVGQTIEPVLPDDPVINLITVGSAFWRVVILSTFVQAAISTLTMLLGVPKGLEDFEDSEAQKIRQRIVGSIVIPLGSIVVGGLIAVAIAQVFLNFHEYAPLFALIISAAILLFASVMSAAPKIKITRSEVLIASAGVLTLIVIIASVAASQH